MFPFPAPPPPPPPIFGSSSSYLAAAALAAQTKWVAEADFTEIFCGQNLWPLSHFRFWSDMKLGNPLLCKFTNFLKKIARSTPSCRRSPGNSCQHRLSRRPRPLRRPPQSTTGGPARTRPVWDASRQTAPKSSLETASKSNHVKICLWCRSKYSQYFNLWRKSQSEQY